MDPKVFLKQIKKKYVRPLFFCVVRISQKMLMSNLKSLNNSISIAMVQAIQK